MPVSTFGPFKCVFEPDANGRLGYLSLLHLQNDNVPSVIDRIEQAMRDEDAPRWIAAQLGYPNWRTHLVAAIAYLLDRTFQLDCALLWRAIDAGS